MKFKDPVEDGEENIMTSFTQLNADIKQGFRNLEDM